MEHAKDDMKKKSEEEDYILHPYSGVQKLPVLQESNRFMKPRVSSVELVKIILKLLYLFGQGTVLRSDELSQLFMKSSFLFGVHKDDLKLRRMLYILINELKASENKFIVTQCLLKDLKEKPEFKNLILKSLKYVLNEDRELFLNFEKYFLENLVLTQEKQIISSVLISSLFFDRAFVKKWIQNIKIQLKSRFSMIQYHSLCSLFYLKKNKQFLKKFLLTSSSSSSSSSGGFNSVLFKNHYLSNCLILKYFRTLISNELKLIQKKKSKKSSSSLDSLIEVLNFLKLEFFNLDEDNYHDEFASEDGQKKKKKKKTSSSSSSSSSSNKIINFEVLKLFLYVFEESLKYKLSLFDLQFMKTNKKSYFFECFFMNGFFKLFNSYVSHPTRHLKKMLILKLFLKFMKNLNERIIYLRKEDEEDKKEEEIESLKVFLELFDRKIEGEFRKEFVDFFYFKSEDEIQKILMEQKKQKEQEEEQEEQQQQEQEDEQEKEEEFLRKGRETNSSSSGSAAITPPSSGEDGGSSVFGLGLGGFGSSSSSSGSSTGSDITTAVQKTFETLSLLVQDNRSSSSSSLLDDLLGFNGNLLNDSSGGSSSSSSSSDYYSSYSSSSSFRIKLRKNQKIYVQLYLIYFQKFLFSFLFLNNKQQQKDKISEFTKLLNTLESFFNDLSNQLKFQFLKEIKLFFLLNCRSQHRNNNDKSKVMNEIIGKYLNFLNKIFTKFETNYEVKKELIESILVLIQHFQISSLIFHDCLLLFCEFIEDCQFDLLLKMIIYYLGKFGVQLNTNETNNESNICFRYLLNRFFLEKNEIKNGTMFSLLKFYLNSNYFKISHKAFSLLRKCSVVERKDLFLKMIFNTFDKNYLYLMDESAEKMIEHHPETNTQENEEKEEKEDGTEKKIQEQIQEKQKEFKELKKKNVLNFSCFESQLKDYLKNNEFELKDFEYDKEKEEKMIKSDDTEKKTEDANEEDEEEAEEDEKKKTKKISVDGGSTTLTSNQNDFYELLQKLPIFKDGETSRDVAYIHEHLKRFEYTNHYKLLNKEEILVKGKHYVYGGKYLILKFKILNDFKQKELKDLKLSLKEFPSDHFKQIYQINIKKLKPKQQNYLVLIFEHKQQEEKIYEFCFSKHSNFFEFYFNFKMKEIEKEEEEFTEDDEEGGEKEDDSDDSDDDEEEEEEFEFERFTFKFYEFLDIFEFKSLQQLKELESISSFSDFEELKRMIKIPPTVPFGDIVKKIKTKLPFVQKLKKKDEKKDVGNERILLKIKFNNDDEMVFVVIHCLKDKDHSKITVHLFYKENKEWAQKILRNII